MPAMEESGIKHKAKSGVEEIRDVVEDWDWEKTRQEMQDLEQRGDESNLKPEVRATGQEMGKAQWSHCVRKL